MSIACKEQQIETHRTEFNTDDKIIPWGEGNGTWLSISQIVSDLTAMDTITLFVQNPFTCDSAESIAVRIGRDPDRIASVLDALGREGLLQVTQLKDIQAYELTQDHRKRQTLQQYVAWMQEGYHWARMVMAD